MRILTDAAITKALRCPICRAEMTVRESGSLVCTGPRMHCFDFGASGYVNLAAPTQSGGGDSKQAVRARSQFLNLGHYEPIAEGICAVLRTHLGDKGALVVDAGCGEGYYSDRIANAGYATVGVDLSKYAVDTAAKRAVAAGRQNAFYAAASVYALPLADGSADAVTNVFAPCAEQEYARVLSKDGILLVAHAGEEHLMGLKRVLYAETHLNAARADLPKEMEKIDEARVRYTVTVEGHEAILSLFAMTPYYWRTAAADAEKLAGLSSLTTEVDVLLTVYRKREGDA